MFSDIYISVGRMTSAVIFVLFAVLTTFVGNVTASCRQIANNDMLEYFCEGGHPSDLIRIPEITEKLRINRMPLHKITTDTFSRFGGNLWVLGCSHCNITDIDVNAFRRLVNLQQLSLDNNHLTSVKAAWFRGLSYLTYLDLNYNNIYEIEDETYQNLPSLVDFRISGNRLRCLNLDAMSHLRELKFMLLSENPEFACPHAVSKFLESQSVTFEKDPEWKKLASDMIDVHIPPSYGEKDNRITPTYHKESYPDGRPSVEQEVLPHMPSSENSGIYSNNHSKHRPRRPTTTIRPTNSKHKEEPIPRVEPRYPFSDIQSNIPKSSIDQKMPYPYSAAETTRASFAESMSAGTIRTADNEKLSQEYTSTYPLYVPASETMNYPSHITSGRSQTPPEDYHQKSSSDTTRIDDINRSLQTERTLIYPSYVPTHDMPQITSERSRAIATEAVSSSHDKTTTGFDRPLQKEHVVTYPLYVSTSSGHEKLNGYIQATYPSIDYDAVSWKTWSDNVPIQHSDDPSSTLRPKDIELYEQFYVKEEIELPSEPDLQKTHFSEELDSLKMIKPSTNDVLIAKDLVERYKEDRSQTTSSDIHYVRPSLSSGLELMHLPSTDESYLTPYYESTVTLYPPLQNYPQHTDTIADVSSLETLTDKPLPECPNRNSAALMTQSVAVLVMSIIIVIFRQVIVKV